MKNYAIIALLAICFCTRAHAKESFADGYIINRNDDTINARIKIPMSFGKFNEQALFYGIVAEDSTGKRTNYKPEDLHGYGFVYQSKPYIYVSKLVDDEGNKMFLWPLHLGKKINEYYYFTSNSVNTDKGSSGLPNEIFVLENEDKVTRSITRGGSLVNTFKDQLRSFFVNDKKMLQLISENVHEFHDISKFVIAANSL